MAKVVKYSFDENGRQSWAFEEVPATAPNDGKQYIMQDGAWVELPVSISGGEDNQIVVRKTGDTANATVNLADSGLSFDALANSDYAIEGWLLWNTSATTVGIKLSGRFSGASPNAIAGQWIVNAANGTLDGAAFNANDVTVTTTAAPFTTNNHAVFFALLRTGVNPGTFSIRFAAETTGTITIKTGSVLRYRKTL